MSLLDRVRRRMADWMSFFSAAQDAISRNERSSGLKPMLVALPVCLVAAIVFFRFAPEYAVPVFTVLVCVPVGVTFGVALVKSFSDPDFLRSESHVEKKLRLATMQKKGETAPTLILPQESELRPIEQSHIAAIAPHGEPKHG